MKKLITGLSLFVSLGVTTATVVSCIPAKFAEGLVGQRIVFITDGGNIRDKSFNESGWDSIIQYGAQIHQNLYQNNNRQEGDKVTFTEDQKDKAQSFDYASSWAGREFRLDQPMVDPSKSESWEPAKKASSNYVETAGHAMTDYYASYKMGLYKKADAILIAGFAHAGSVNKLIKWTEKEGKTLIFLDGVIDYAYKKNAQQQFELDQDGRKIPTKNKNTISVQFDSELSGFNAAWDAALWANMPKIDMTTGQWVPGNQLNGDASGDGRISMGAFGGISAKTAVDNTIWGYLVAVQLFNTIIAGQNFQLTDATGVVKNFTPQKIQFGNVGSDELSQVKVINKADPTWYTHSFSIGDANRSGLLPNLIKNQTDIIMGVAGPQTNDIAKEITGATYRPFVIGVDTDQVLTVGKDTKAEDRFITSSTKGLTQAAFALFKKSRSLKYIYKDESKKEIVGYVNGPEIEDGFLAKQEPDWTISSSRASDDKWMLGKNLAINALDFRKGIGKKIFDQLPKVYQQAGDTPEQYISAHAISEAIRMIMEENNVPSSHWTMTRDGIDGYESYFTRLLASLNRAGGQK
ncbi:hypothetical protein [Williamsoniiplasma lucivorax]|uniref:Ribose/galactose ABC transporter substrate-binding protein n=1 Tax=Williamsoniiplasma lucivorax TaxID=209274 RepID=A0A2S5RDU2_9MOLU|nr:hypothetical protein [Williamsoniiplasma lucivorax]PPE05509.1 ribose/galactose ABC transporter substrate-binding protein [Williamsoniiplasma lucivorax]